LSSVNIPSSVTSIGIGAFIDCSSLNVITVAENNAMYHSKENCLIETDSKTLILGCKNSIIPDDGSVINIGDYAFYDCSNLTCIDLPEGLISIGSSAFFGCKSLRSINIPKNISKINYTVFSGCNLDEIRVDSENMAYSVQGNCLIETETGTLIVGCNNSIIPTDGSVIKIGPHAFSGRRNLKSISVPDSVHEIGFYAFRECTSLTELTISQGVTKIGHYIVGSCTNLKNIYFIGNPTQWNEIDISQWNEELFAANLIFLMADSTEEFLKEKITASQYFTDMGDNYECTVYKGAEIITEDTVLGTGMIIEAVNKETSESSWKEIVIYGDVTGDGQVSAADYMKVKRSIVQPDLLVGANFIAGDLDKDGILKTSDYMKIRRHITGSYNIYDNIG